MRRVFNRFENINIKYKLFLITTGLLIALAMIIYMILYLLLPSYYHQYKIGLLENGISTLCEEAPNHDTSYLQERLYYMSRSQNLSIMLKNQNGKVRVTDIANKMICTKPSVNKALNNLKKERTS